MRERGTAACSREPGPNPLQSGPGSLPFIGIELGLLKRGAPAGRGSRQALPPVGLHRGPVARLAIGRSGFAALGAGDSLCAFPVVLTG